MNKTILIIEDEKDIIELIRYNLAKEGYETQSLEEGVGAIDIIKSNPPSLILLDLMLPAISGLDICKQLKSDPITKHIPVILVTAKSEEVDIVLGLELGADDYITKPFSPRILVARVKSVLRRSGTLNIPTGQNILQIHDLKMDPDKREAILKGECVGLTYSEFETLYLLATNPGRVYTRYQIVENVHGNDYAVTDRSIDVLFVSIRKKLAEHAPYIETIRGVGYRFVETLA